MTIDPLRGDALQPGWLMFINCAPAVRVWSGVANFKLGPCGADTAGGVYQGLGLMVAVPGLRIPINGAYAAHTFSLAGVTAAIMALANAERNIIRGARISWARFELDIHGNPIAQPQWIWTGWVDSPRVSRDGKTIPPSRAVALVCATGAVRRGVRKYAYWTSPQQRLLDPNDASCDNVSLYAEGTSVVWPS